MIDGKTYDIDTRIIKQYGVRTTITDNRENRTILEGWWLGGLVAWTRTAGRENVTSAALIDQKSFECGSLCVHTYICIYYNKYTYVRYQYIYKHTYTHGDFLYHAHSHPVLLSLSPSHSLASSRCFPPGTHNRMDSGSSAKAKGARARTCGRSGSVHLHLVWTTGAHTRENFAYIINACIHTYAGISRTDVHVWLNRAYNLICDFPGRAKNQFFFFSLIYVRNVFEKYREFSKIPGSESPTVKLFLLILFCRYACPWMNARVIITQFNYTERVE